MAAYCGESEWRKIGNDFIFSIHSLMGDKQQSVGLTAVATDFERCYRVSLTSEEFFSKFKVINW